MPEERIQFSVAMSLYKGDDPEQLRAALDSICTQSYLPSEIFLVIDGPIGENLEGVLTEYVNKYDFFTIHRFEKNQGLGVALNVAVEKCKYDIIIRMDSDDISAPGRFEKQIKAYLEEPADVIGGWTIGFSGDLYAGKVSAAKRKLTHEEIVARIGSRSPMSHVTVMFRREAVLKAGNYQGLFYHEDYYLWARMIQAGCTFRNIPEYLVYVRLGENQAKRHGGIRYYKAGSFLRKYLLKHKIISFGAYLKETAIRIVYQLLIPSSFRNYLAMKYKRKYISREEADAIIKINEEYGKE